MLMDLLRFCIVFIGILIILLFGTFLLYAQQTQQTKYITKEYTKMIDTLTQECKIDLNQLQQNTINQNKCRVLKQMLDFNTISQNTFDSYCTTANYSP